MDSEHVVGGVVKGNAMQLQRKEKKKLGRAIGLVRKLGTDWKIYNIKDAFRSMNKIQEISKAKRIVIIKRSEKKQLRLLKKGKKLDNIKFPEVNLVHEIKHKQLVSLHKLLVQLATENWREDPELQWLPAVFPPDMNNHKDTNSQTEDYDEDVHEHAYKFIVLLFSVVFVMLF
ncbi:hypothetical protein ILUMI_03495 [Ignelater luminosus]|uniref:Uncharacterized protein n=1 Tax=Ignelater luminosus TaxID=2038154 RepID=A0A8K0DG64_IGNLU|nr:hypothetical protein ILUMI_03495 [Ignelater luminosus]